MNRKSKVIVSIVGITIVLLALLGITYAYYLTRIKGNTNTNSISITTADLKLEYGDGNGDLVFTNIMPGWINDGLNGNPEPKRFVVTNSGNSSVNEYAVSLEEVTNTLSRTEDLTYTLKCIQKNSVGVVTGTCNGNTEEFPKSNTMLMTNSIESGYTHEYQLIVNYINHETINQSIDMGSTIKGKVQIYGLTDTVDLTGTVSNFSDGDYVQINSETKTSKIVNNEYKLVGIKPGTHSLKVCGANTSCETPVYKKTIVINKGAEAGVGTTTIEGETYPLITITNESQIVRINIDISSSILDVNSTVINYNPFEQGTLAYNIYQNKALVEEYDVIGTSLGTKLNKDIKSLPIVTSVSDGTNIEDSGLFIAADDYGTSYFYRGTVRNNYVNFAGFTWRIVRINGDGSVRLILDGTLDKVKREGLDVIAGSTSRFNSSYTNNAYVGYMYGYALTNNVDQEVSRCLNLIDNVVTDVTDMYSDKQSCELVAGKWTTNSYETTHANVKSSTIKNNVDSFYENYIENDTYHYEQYLSDNIFCGDKNIAQDGIGGVEVQLGFGTNKVYYESRERIFYNNDTSPRSNPSLECSKVSDNVFSRYSSKMDSNNYTNKGVKINNDLLYPIGLLSADELVLSGALYDTQNQYYYLSDAYKNDLSNDSWVMMTPYMYNNSSNRGVILATRFTTKSLTTHFVNVANGVRPVINLRHDLILESGNGTKDSPYIVKLNNN